MPFFDPNLLKTLLSKIGNEDIATLVCEATSSEIIDPNVVKAVISWDDKQKDLGNALYFSRSSVPYNAEFYWHHIGVYAWKRNSLKNFVSLAPSQIELIEKLEQLRALENGMIIKAIKVDENPIGVDTTVDKMPFYPYCYVKDLFVFLSFCLIRQFSISVWFICIDNSMK